MLTKKNSIVNELSIKLFLRNHNYFFNSNISLLKDNDIPKPFCEYFKITNYKIIYLKYGYNLSPFNLNYRAKLEHIDFAYRDGKTEYEVLIKKQLKIQNELIINSNNKCLRNKLKNISKVIQSLPIFQEKKEKETKFEDCLIDTKYCTTINLLKNKYLVIDVETNGLKSKEDDLLSLSIYDPTSGIGYNRFFPLDLEPTVLTTQYNGIYDSSISNESHLTQTELDKVLNYFNIKDKILLSYSGGKGLFDIRFIQNYCKRHSLVGFDKIQCENIKSRLAQGTYDLSYQLTKDNLCKLFHIANVKKFIQVLMIALLNGNCLKNLHLIHTFLRTKIYINLFQTMITLYQ